MEKGSKYVTILTAFSSNSSSFYSTQKNPVLGINLQVYYTASSNILWETTLFVRHFTLYWVYNYLSCVHPECKLIKCLFWSIRYHRVLALLKKLNAVELTAWWLIRLTFCNLLKQIESEGKHKQINFTSKTNKSILIK